MRKRTGPSRPHNSGKKIDARHETRRKATSIHDRELNRAAAIQIAKNVFNRKSTGGQVTTQELLLAGAIMLRQDPHSFLDRYTCERLANQNRNMPEAKQYLAALKDHDTKK